MSVCDIKFLFFNESYQKVFKNNNLKSTHTVKAKILTVLKLLCFMHVARKNYRRENIQLNFSQTEKKILYEYVSSAFFFLL